MRFCNKTKGLSDEQNSQYAKDLKEFNKSQVEKFRKQETREDSDE